MKRILSFFLGGDDGPSASQIRRAVKAVTEPHGDPAARMNAAERLRAWGTKEALAGLLRRFTIQVPSGTVDLEECQEIEKMLIGLGRPAVEPMLAFLLREAEVAYPARALEKILPKEEFVARILGVLDQLEAGFSSHNEQRAGLIRALEESDDPRVAPGVRRFLLDPDDDVSNAAIACIARAGDESFRSDLVETLLKSADRPRVRREAAERLAALGWEMGESRTAVATALPAGFTLDRKGRVVAAG